jgi:hypothetical protein
MSLLTYFANSNTSAPNAQLDAALANLADISLGKSPDIWPLAWGWWVLIVLAIAVIVGLTWFTRQYIRKHKYKRDALKAISMIDDNTNQGLRKLHVILRRVVIHYMPSEHINSLQGQAWQNFLQTTARGSKKIEQQSFTHLKELEASLYTKEPSITASDAKAAVYLWIKHCLPPASSQQVAKGVQDV